MRQRSSRVGALVGAAALLLLAGCGKTSDSSTGGGTKELLIGNIASNAGQYSICVPQDVTLQVAIDEINNGGGIKAGNTTYTLRLESIDDQSDVAKDAAAARKLLQEGAKFIFGPCGAGAAGVVQLTQPSKVVLISSASSAAGVIKPGGARAYILTVIPSITNRVASAVDAIKKFEPSRKSMVMLGSNDPTFGAVVDGAKSLWTGDGRTVKTVLYPPGTSDLGAFVAKVKAENPDILYIGQNPQTVTLALQQLDAAGISKNTLIVGHGTEAALAAQAGGRPYVAVPFSPGPMTGDGANAATKTLVQKYLDKTGKTDLPAYAPPIRYFYDVMYILKAAMEKAGTADDTDKILDQFLGMDTGYQGALGKTNFDKDGFILYPLVSTYVAQNGSQQTTTWEPGS
jgi:branched-chain amino acid transport system substrate-binding protein